MINSFTCYTVPKDVHKIYLNMTNSLSSNFIGSLYIYIYIFVSFSLSVATRVIPLEITWWSDEVSTDTLLPANPPLTSSSH